METKAFFLVLPPASKTANVRQIESIRWMPLILLLSISGVISGCDRKVPEPGEPMIEPQEKNATPDDRTRSPDDDPGADR